MLSRTFLSVDDGADMHHLSCVLGNGPGPLLNMPTSLEKDLARDPGRALAALLAAGRFCGRPCVLPRPRGRPMAAAVLLLPSRASVCSGNSKDGRPLLPGCCSSEMRSIAGFDP